MRPSGGLQRGTADRPDTGEHGATDSFSFAAFAGVGSRERPRTMANVANELLPRQNPSEYPAEWLPMLRYNLPTCPRFRRSWPWGGQKWVGACSFWHSSRSF